MVPRPTQAEHIRQYTICPCALYLDHYGPEDERAEAHAFLEYLMELGHEHEQMVAATLSHKPVPFGPIPMRAEVTLRLMRKGMDRIYQPVLVHEDLAGVPDFLEKTNVPSELGSFSYRPADAKISTSAKKEHEAQLAFYALLLGQVQGNIPDTGDLILVDHSRETVELSEAIDDMPRMIAEVREIREGRRESPTLSADCGMCPWHDHCLRVLHETNDISLVEGLGKAKKPSLVEAGYGDLRAIARARPETLSQIRGIGAKTETRIVRQAQVLMEGHPRILSAPHLPEADVELYLDMECQRRRR